MANTEVININEVEEITEPCVSEVMEDSFEVSDGGKIIFALGVGAGIGSYLLIKHLAIPTAKKIIAKIRKRKEEKLMTAVNAVPISVDEDVETIPEVNVISDEEM